MTRKKSGRTIGLLVAVALVSTAFAVPPDTVDFSLVPEAGLKFKVTEAQNITIQGKLAYTDSEVEMNLDQKIDGKEVFTQTIKKVTDGRIVEIEREYEDAGQKMVTRTEMLPEPQELERSSPVAWKHFRAAWKEDGFSLVVKDDDEWKEARDDIKQRLSPRRLLQPKMPFPAGPKKVGDSWELSAKDLKDYFADTAGGGAGASEVEVDGTARFTFVEVADFEVSDKKAEKCAVIDFKIKLRVSLGDGPSPEFTLNGRLYYAIQPRIFYGMKGEGTMRIQGEQQRGGQTVRLDLNGTLKSNLKVEVLVRPEPEKEGE